MNRFRWLFVITSCCVALSSCRWSNSAQPPLLSTMTPKAGGMILPTDLAAQPAAPGGAASLSDVGGLQVGQLVVVVNPDGLKLYGDATLTSEVRGLYPTGATLTVLEPSGAYPVYPVQSDNHDWYRFQAADGLVGWAMIEAIVSAASLPTATATPAG